MIPRLTLRTLDFMTSLRWFVGVATLLGTMSCGRDGLNVGPLPGTGGTGPGGTSAGGAGGVAGSGGVPLTWHRGNVHTHSRESDGSGTPAEMAAAYEKLGYDFLVMTDHNKLTSFSGRSTSMFIAIDGEEVSTIQGSPEALARIEPPLLARSRPPLSASRSGGRPRAVCAG